MLNKQDFTMKRRWDDDVVFKNQARGTEDKGKKEFVNVSCFHDSGTFPCFHLPFLAELQLMFLFRTSSALISTGVS